MQTNERIDAAWIESHAKPPTADHQLLLWALTTGGAKWYGATSEIGFDAIRYCVGLDDYGLPQATNCLRRVLLNAWLRQQQQRSSAPTANRLDKVQSLIREALELLDKHAPGLAKEMLVEALSK